MRQMNFPRLLLLVASGLCGLMLAGCRTHSQDSDSAQVRLINTVSDTSALAVSVEGQHAWKNSEYRSNTGYQSLAAGTYGVRVEATDSGAALTAHPLSLEARKSYTLLAVGLEHSAEFPATVEVISDDSHRQGDSDKATLRFINASPGFGPADVLLNNIVALKQIGYNHRSDPALLDSGTYDIKVNPAESADTALGPISLTLDSGHSYTLILMGPPSGSGFTLEAYSDNP